VPRPDPTTRFAELVAGPEASLPLDEASLLIAAHAHPELDVEVEMRRLDALADAVPAPTLDGVCAHLFRDLGFRGDEDDYYDPANSYLHSVVARRRGIPITLSVVVIEVGRRVGAPMAGVSMPGHFLVRDRVDTDVFVDPFHRGALLTPAECERLFNSIHRGRLAFDEGFLDPVGARAVLARMLLNLKAIFLTRRDRSALLWVQRLRAMIPGSGLDEVRELAAALAANGRLDEAAELLEELAEDGDEASDADLRLAAGLRARLN
jgi:regulator of sirC expression with transglutaminase-like and TPR domain